MRRLAWVAGGLVALAAGALVLLPSLVNVEQFRGLIRGQLQQSLARDVDFGAMRLKLWPLSIALDDLRIAPRYPELIAVLEECEFKGLTAEVRAEAGRTSAPAAAQGELF